MRSIGSYLTTQPWRWLGYSLALLLWLVLELFLIAWAGTLWREDQTPQQAAPPGRWVAAHDVDVYVQEFGNPQDPPMLLVHGTGAWSGTWVSNTSAMVQAGYRVIAVDLPPFGFSTRPANRDYSRPAQAQRLAALLRHLQLPPAIVLGHSYGGGPAAELAMRAPEQVRALVLVDAALGLQESPPAPSKPASGSAAQTLLALRSLRSAMVASVVLQPSLSSYWLSQFVARTEVVTPERTAIYQQPFRVRQYSASLGDWAYQFAFDDHGNASQQAQQWQRLRMPLHIMWGALDSVTPLEQAQTLHRLVPHSTLDVLQGVGHIPQIEDVALFNQRLQAWLVTQRAMATD
ncbi:alpha/beta hydrolase [Curvibacter sp. CHRR-16]|uniref:alpha/beta fold hydrolase n=1 Tax=Curvibacter sp. CHRR-16 TaxID=2835872 RepID=UPI001BDA5B37|nr:alpha/beta hydrolase [Curvibacter sp. CHRR-16]MBT0570468.1 alpha/beta hydrolase [Curvibacter sp. CHRR-16]